MCLNTIKQNTELQLVIWFTISGSPVDQNNQPIFTSFFSMEHLAFVQY